MAKFKPIDTEMLTPSDIANLISVPDPVYNRIEDRRGFENYSKFHINNVDWRYKDYTFDPYFTNVSNLDYNHAPQEQLDQMAKENHQRIGKVRDAINKDAMSSRRRSGKIQKGWE